MISFFSQTTEAKKLYKYQDSKGAWYFSDTPPETGQKVEVRQLKAANKRYLWLQKRGDKYQPEYFLINKHKAPIEVEISLVDSENVKATPALPKRFIISTGNSKTLFQIAGINPSKGWQYSLMYRYVIGSPLAKHDDNVSYLPPFQKNKSVKISQAFNGKFSHTDKQNKYAVDLAMDINTPIHAARAGIVIEVNDDFIKGGTKQAYATRANSIRILHDDGTMAVYAHLALESAQVYPGLKVYTGQLIGYSGNTGFSSGPHLHFAVQINKGMELVSVPFKFKSTDNISATPTQGDILQN